MRIVIAAVGRLKSGPETELCKRYQTRFDASGRTIGLGPITYHEIPEGRQSDAAGRIADEANRLLERTSDAGRIIALDETGKLKSSAHFARDLATARDDGIRDFAFLIGGPDGHGEAARNAAQSSLSLGRMTLPHGLARVVLLEQLYRAATILSGHPYHRS